MPTKKGTMISKIAMVLKTRTSCWTVCLVVLALRFLVSCEPLGGQKGKAQYQHHCAGCHQLPEIGHLPKTLWAASVLPDMRSRMQIEELYVEGQSGKPTIKWSDWLALESYVLAMAPESLPKAPLPESTTLQDFSLRSLSLDDQKGTFFTFMAYDSNKNAMLLGDMTGALNSYGFSSNRIEMMYQGKTPITWHARTKKGDFMAEVGILDPSEEKRGRITFKGTQDMVSIAEELHRPVHLLAEDLNGDGTEELVVSEFGNETGSLSLLWEVGGSTYAKQPLLPLPGCIRTLAKDMDGDGKKDLIVLSSQANECVHMLYQKDSLRFEAHKVLDFSPLFGSSWFELVDYNKDGYDDIVTVNGDNADKTYVHKPYHGMRIHINDGQNNFKQAFFYPLNGATRFISHDFDEDGDLDFAILSTFPDYETAPDRSFVYLENIDSAVYRFKTKTLASANAGRWFLMDKGDVDRDGDMDIILSAFTYVFTPVPKALSNQWSQSDKDVWILENQLN